MKNMEIAGNEVRSVSLDHHGLVAAICKDLKISSRIDERIYNEDERRVVSPGKSVVAMILNGLGFTNRRLYLTSQFFENKPVELLLDAPIEAKDLTDYTLGHSLDEIAKYGSSKMFAELAFEIATEHDLLGELNHIDTTSMSLNGKYETVSSEHDLAPETINITYGHSKDHRPDLKQVVLSLVVNGPSSIPLWMEPLDGNSSDKTSFHETIAKINEFKKQLNLEQSFRWVADSALYSKEKLLKKDNPYLWVSRVPETIKEAKELVGRPKNEFDWQDYGDGYMASSLMSEYGSVKQRWLLVYSEQAYHREKKTLEKKIEKQETALKKALWHLENQQFNCSDDAEKALIPIRKKYKHHDITSKVVPVKKYGKPGKPKEGDKKIITGYRVESQYAQNTTAIDEQLNRKGRFILATNDLDIKNYSDQKIFNDYKSQQNVERGFRFLKDPWFMIDSIFLKSPQRIEALMMVMTLCLLVYNLAQHKLRSKLKEENETLPNQLGKQIQNPTMRWIFQVMEGIGIVRFYQEEIKKPFKEIITNLNEIRKKIIRLFGKAACKMYGLIQINDDEILGM
jgi:transposase